MLMCRLPSPSPRIAKLIEKSSSALGTIGIVGLLVSVGCAGSATGTDGPVGRDTYPEGPYGVEEGDIMEGLEFVDKNGDAYGLADIFADEDNKLLLLNTAAGWCAACRDEQPALQQLVDDRGDDGLAMVVTIFQDDSSQEATTDFVDGWISQYQLTFPVLLDAPFLMSDYYDPSATPLSMIIEVDTMEILRSATGWDQNAVEGIIDAKL